MRNKKIFALSSLIVSGLLAVTAVGNAFSLFRKDASSLTFTIGEAQKHNVRIYNAYSSSWNYTDYAVVDGAKISVVTDPSASGYTFEGWVTSTPSSTNYTPQKTTTEVNNITCTEDLVFYPIFKSTAKKVYTNSNDSHYYYNIDEDVVVNYKLLKQTLYGYCYLGFDGIPDPESSWIADRDLVTNSGIYRFFDVDGGLNIKRKVGALFTGTIWNNNNEWEHYKVNAFANSEATAYVEQLYRYTTDTKDKIMSFYLRYDITDIQFLRMDSYYSEQYNWGNKKSLSSGYTSTNWIIDNSAATSWNNWDGTWRAQSTSTFASTNWGFESAWTGGYAYHL